MIKFVHLSDLHLGIKKYGKLNHNTGLNTRLEEDLKQLDKCIKFVLKHEYKYMFITGDVFDSRCPDDIARKEFAKRLKILNDNKIHTIVLMGNHDNVTSKDKAHCLSSEKVLVGKYIHIIDRDIIIEFNEGEFYVLCLPYQKKYNKVVIEDFIKQVVVLGHFTINGSRKDDYIFAGDEYTDSNIFNDRRIIYVGLGHIHNHQNIKNIIYSGSLNRINFNDENSIKGFIKGKLNNGKCKWKFIKLNSRKFLTINEKWDGKLKKRLDSVDVNNKIVKLNITVSENKIVPTKKIKKYFNKKFAIVDSINVNRNFSLRVRDKNYNNKMNPIDTTLHYFKNESNDIKDMAIEFLRKIK